jgi:O-antigen ligase
VIAAMDQKAGQEVGRFVPRVFNVIVAAHVLAYVSFLETILVVVGERKVYLIDVVFAFLALFVLVAPCSRKPRAVWGSQRSTKVFVLLIAWGLIGLVRGMPEFGLSAFGEARLFVLQMLFYFFVAAAYRDKRGVKKFVTFAVTVVCAMPVVRAILFYFGGGRDTFIAQFAGSHAQSAQADFRFIQAGEAVLVACVAVGLLMFPAGGGVKRHRQALRALAMALLLVVAIVQVRAAWVSCAVGLVVGSLQIRRFRTHVALGIVAGSAALAIGTMFVSVMQIDSERFWDSIAYSRTFLRDPGEDETAQWRLVLWQQAVESIAERPVVGHGLGGYFENVGPDNVAVNQTYHNGYLVLLEKLGGVGLALLMIALCLWFVELAQFIRHERDTSFRLLARALGVSVTMLATFAFFYDFTIAFWVVLGAGTALVRHPPLTVSQGRRMRVASVCGRSELDDRYGTLGENRSAQPRWTSQSSHRASVNQSGCDSA